MTGHQTAYGQAPQCMHSGAWASREGPETVFASTDKTMTILPEGGPNQIGTWQDEEVEIVADYQKACGARPPVSVRIAIMDDSDNTGGRAVFSVGCIEGFR